MQLSDLPCQLCNEAGTSLKYQIHLCDIISGLFSSGALKLQAFVFYLLVGVVSVMIIST